MTDARDAAVPIRPDYPEPLWIQAVDLISREIASGVLTPGSRLPPERALCQQLHISRVTLRRALSKLVEDGVLRPSHGRGWYVADPAGTREWPSTLESFSETASRMGLTATSRVLHAGVVPADLDEAERLSVAPGTLLFELERVRLLGDVPIAIDRTRIPAALVPDFSTADFRTDSLYVRLAEAGVEPAWADSTIEARAADDDVARHLELQVGRPILVMHQVVIDAAERPLFTSTIQYSGERYRLRTVFARSRGSTRPNRSRAVG